MTVGLVSQVGTPERPLSDLGRVSYHGYWTRELLAILAQHEGTISIKVWCGELINVQLLTKADQKQESGNP
jgi:hypothetical protein